MIRFHNDGCGAAEFMPPGAPSPDGARPTNEALPADAAIRLGVIIEVAEPALACDGAGGATVRRDGEAAFSIDTLGPGAFWSPWLGSGAR